MWQTNEKLYFHIHPYQKRPMREHGKSGTVFRRLVAEALHRASLWNKQFVLQIWLSFTIILNYGYILKPSSWTRSFLERRRCSIRSQAVSVSVVDLRSLKQCASKGSQLDRAKLHSGSNIESCLKITKQVFCIRIASAFLRVLWIISILLQWK